MEKSKLPSSCDYLDVPQGKETNLQHCEHLLRKKQPPAKFQVSGPSGLGYSLMSHSQPFSMKWPSGAPWCMTTTWSTTYVVEKCDVMWKLPHPVLTGGSERQLRKLTFGIDLSDYNVG
ncbi:hypothetical protein AVEN_196430-1 [Araneus ventricosus]|uniref:Uncharacterized protein n=1 Tax=Araneus ventricosus TaxID=182803 RepID=A0A4Y2AX05_ARAVE|nr:hypothetical protein AVEN_196430-1 [Araneus ventricosus]